MRRLATVTRLRVTELLRQPLTLVMLLLLPPIVIELYGVAVSSFPQLPTLGADPVTVGRMTGTLFSVAFLAGLVGLFQVISARNGDERAAIAGFPRWELLTTRLVTMLVIAGAGAGVAFATLSYTVDVAAPVLAVGFLVLAALIYGLMGVIVGTLLPQELEGSIVLVFLADIDNALSAGLFSIEASTTLPLVGEIGVTDFVPLYHPHELFVGAVLEGDIASGHLPPALGWVVGLVVIAFVAYGRTAGDGWLTARGGGG
jgi:ABC-2 type transport system permease protein